MPDHSTPLSPLAGIELRHDDECPLRGYIAIETDDCGCEAQRKASYLTGLGKVLEEIPTHDMTLPPMMREEEYRLACMLFTGRLSTYLTSPRETVGKEKE